MDFSPANNLSIDQINFPQLDSQKNNSLAKKLNNIVTSVSQLAYYIFSLIIAPFCALKNVLFGNKKIVPANDQEIDSNKSNTSSAINNLVGSLLKPSDQKPHTESSGIKIPSDASDSKGSIVETSGETENLVQNKDAKNDPESNENSVKDTEAGNNGTSVPLLDNFVAFLEANKKVALDGIFEKIAKNLPPKYEKEDIPTCGGLLPNWFDFRGSKWLDSYHIFAFILLMTKEFPNLSTPDNLYPYELDDAERRKFLFDRVIADGHFDSDYANCTHDLQCLEKKIFAYPIHVTKNHWTLAIVDREKRTVEYYDSKKNYGNHGTIIKGLKELAEVLSKTDNANPEKEDYTFIEKVVKNIQPDVYQCGIWSCYFLEQRLKDPDFKFELLEVSDSQPKIANFRLYVMDKLIKNIKLIQPIINLLVS